MSSSQHSNDGSRRGALLRWFICSATLNVPQAAAPVAFSLLALSLTGETSGGAVMILVMTIAQVAGAIPITKFGRKASAANVLRLLIILRTLALIGVVISVHYDAPFFLLLLFCGVAGSVNGAAYGYLRSLLNHFTPASGLPRALAIATTLNEVTFVLAPVVASVLGTYSPGLAVLTLTIIGSVPAIFIPNGGHHIHSESVSNGATSIFGPWIVLWLACSAAGGAAVAVIEIGAVALALKFGYEPALAILFTVPLCIASVIGGIWVGVRNRMADNRNVLVQISTMTLGVGLVAFGPALATTIAGTVLIGLMLAPLGTYYALVLDRLAPATRRAEVFALLRTSNAVGIIFASAVLTAASLSTALMVVSAMMCAVSLLVAAVFFAQTDASL